MKASEETTLRSVPAAQGQQPAALWDAQSAVAQIDKCDFECDGGPLANNVAYRWLKERLAEGPRFMPGQRVWFEVTAEANGIKLAQWTSLWVCGVSMDSTSERRIWVYSLTHDRPDAYHYGKVLFSSIREERLLLERPATKAVQA